MPRAVMLTGGRRVATGHIYVTGCMPGQPCCRLQPPARRKGKGTPNLTIADKVYAYLEDMHRRAKDAGETHVTVMPEDVAEAVGVSPTGDSYIHVCQALVTKTKLTRLTRLRLAELKYDVL